MSVVYAVYHAVNQTVVNKHGGRSVVQRCIRCGKCFSRSYRCSICQTEAQKRSLSNPWSSNCSILPFYSARSNISTTMTSRTRHPLSCLRSNLGLRNDGRCRSASPPQRVAGDCDWLKQLKRFTAGAFCFGSNCFAWLKQNSSKLFWSVLFQFRFVVRTAFLSLARALIGSPTSNRPGATIVGELCSRLERSIQGWGGRRVEPKIFISHRTRRTS